MPRPLTIVVGGYIVAYPLGGMTWHHLNYLLGLHELGHEIIFLEDSGSYAHPYNPLTNSVGDDPEYGLEYLKRTFADFGLPIKWCYYSEFLDRYWGLTFEELNQTLKRADLMLCVSGVTPIRENRPRARRMMVIDTDPVFTQLRMGRDAGYLKYFQQFDAIATFGRLIGTPSCPLPTHGFNWIPTNQPIALAHWPVVSPGDGAFTTIGKWEQAGERDVEFNGKKYSSSKSIEWMKLLDLPRQVPWEMQLGQLNMPKEIQTQFAAAGWKLFDPAAASVSCSAYGDFIRHSIGEFTVAKGIYRGIPTGWFSDRSAAYLASGRPVVTQSTGFEKWLPTGEGLFNFVDLPQAADALNTIATDYPRHSAAARAIAETYFDSRKILPNLLTVAMG
ncbi:MAG: hypothetical protein ABSG31_06870 [Tepidisphaeraceae bacterium]|jgi:hypothetical protein